MYRVLCELTIDDGESTGSIIWQGESANELSRKYPPSEIFGADPLDLFSCSDFSKTYHFERRVGDEWAKIDDPRVRTTPLTEREEAIDAENRRLYPGDYLDESDDEVSEAYDQDDDLCDLCSSAHHYGPCDLEKINLEKLKVVDVRDGCTVYDAPPHDYIIVEGNTRIELDSHLYKQDARPLHWLREAATT